MINHPYPARTVCSLIEQQVDRNPDSVALICGDGKWTYSELDKRANQLAQLLKLHYNLGPEMMVGLIVGRSENMLISILGILKSGAAYIPVNPQFPPNRVAYILKDAQPAVVITEQKFSSLIQGYGGEILILEDVEETLTEYPNKRLADKPASGHLAYIMYTSGSSGTPKGVMTEHSNLFNFIQWCQEEYQDSNYDIVYAGTPYCFDLSNIELYFPLTVGKKIRMLASNQMLALFLRRDKNILLNTVPSLVREMLKTNGILSNVTVLNLGGEKVPCALGKALTAYPGMEIRNMYGPTESTSTSINYRIDQGGGEVLIGLPIDNTYAYILDENQQKLLPGKIGEICIGGKGLARGYLNRPELTQTQFIEDPFRPNHRIYLTGDLGMLMPGGSIKFIGRKDNQVKINGYRVELDEIGLCLCNHPKVEEAVVIARENPASKNRLVAYVCTFDNNLKDEDLLAFLEDELPSYMMPKEFIYLDSFPLNENGKIDRHALC